MINPMDLSGRIIMVTGASSGLGRETSILLSQLGAHVILVGRNEEQLNKTLFLMEGDRHYIKPYDLKKVDEISNWMKAIAAESGPLRGLVHSAGISVTLPLRGTSTKKLEEIEKNIAIFTTENGKLALFPEYSIHDEVFVTDKIFEFGEIIEIINTPDYAL